MILSIAMPSQEQIYAHTAFDMAHMVADLVASGVSYIPMINPQRANVEIGRSEAVKQAIDFKSDFLLFIDSDARFPPYAARQLLSRKKDIIGVNARKRDGSGSLAITHNIHKKKLGNNSEGITKVKFIGMHLTLINMRVFDKIEKPWFYTNYEKGTDNWIAEDQCFCHEARQAGFHIYCDNDLSKEIGHIGAKTYYI